MPGKAARLAVEGENRACGSADVALVGGVVEGVAEGEGFGEGGNAEEEGVMGGESGASEGRCVARKWGRWDGVAEGDRRRGEIGEDDLGEPVEEELGEGQEAGILVGDAEPEGGAALHVVCRVSEGLVEA